MGNGEMTLMLTASKPNQQQVLMPIHNCNLFATTGDFTVRPFQFPPGRRQCD